MIARCMHFCIIEYIGIQVVPFTIILLEDLSVIWVNSIFNKSTQRVYDAERHFHLNECITVYMSELRKIQLNK